MSKPAAKRGPPVAAAARLGLTIGETEALAALAFMSATGPESDPFAHLQDMAATWRDLIAEICPTPSPRSET